jgi:nucleotide-binding universal stress UspA family protein
MCATASLAAVGYMPPDGAGRERTGNLSGEMLREAIGLDLAIVHAPGDPVTELLRIAGDLHADLIVVGRDAVGPHRTANLVGQRLADRRRQSAIFVVL